MQQFLSQLKIRTKLLVGFAVLLSILMLASSLIRLKLFDVRNEVDRLVKDHRPVEQLTLELDRHLDDAFATLGMFISMHDETSVKHYHEVFANINRTITKLEQTTNVTSNPKAKELLNNIQRHIDELQEYDNLLLSIGDDESNYPGLTYAKNHLYPVGQEIQQQLTQLTHTKELNLDRIDYELLLLKTDLRYNWVSVMSSIRAYLAYHRETVLEDNRLHLDAVHQTLREIGSDKFSLDPEEQSALQQFKQALRQFEEGWKKLQSIHASEHWRTDRFLMRNHIAPLHYLIDDELDSFIKEQQYRMDNISNQLLESSERISYFADLFLLLGLITGIGMAMGISGVIAKPIQQITSAMEDIAGGDTDLTRRLNVTGNDEVARLARSFNSFALKAQHRAEEEHALSNMLRLSLQQSDLETYLRDALNNIIETVTWLSLIPKGGIYLCRPGQINVLELTAAYNFSETQMYVCGTVPFGHCLCGQAVESREIVFMDHSDHQHINHYEETQPHCHYLVPIRLGDSPLGLMTLYLPHGYGRSATKEAFLYKVAEILSMGISLRQANQELLVAKQQAESFNEQLTGITANIPGIIYQCRISPTGELEYPYVSPGTGALLGKSQDDPANDIHQLFADTHDQDKDRLAQTMMTSIMDLQPINLEYRINQLGSGTRWILCNALPRRTKGGETIWDGLLLDITDRKNLENKLLQSQKLESVGQLAAGIAHEINTPTQYVQDNTRFLNDAFEDYMQTVDAYRQLRMHLAEADIPAAWLEQVDEICNTVDAEYLESEIPHAINQSLDGLKRISTIVSAMKEFSHPGTDIQQPMDINAVIENLVTVTRNEWKYVADLDLSLSDNLPSPLGFRDKLGQVILNIIINAAHAISDQIEAGKFDKGHIGIATQYQDSAIEIRVSDNGAGIPLEIQEKIFDPFFTTKDVGKGTGQGLSIAHSVIVELHQGNLAVESIPGQGASFIINLPVDDKSMSVAANDLH